MTANATQILTKYWGHTSFREPQLEIISSVLKGNDTIALLPTGGGKSICFQIPALLQKGICIVISPLLALMQDQVEGLKQRGIKAMWLPPGTSQDELITLFDNVRFGNYQFLYLSPERLQSKFIQEKIKQLEVGLIAIDEAHCISEWGHDFRPSYLNLTILRELHPHPPIIALTATATQKVLEQIKDLLELKTPNVFKKSFQRKNLAYQIFQINDKLGKLIQILHKMKAPSIVYVSSRKKTKEISSFLNASGFKSSYYHGGLSFVDKQIMFERWISEETPIMVATNAFGMGIDKANVRVVIHLNLPSSLENYIQEAGRAGRDGKKAFAVTLTNANDTQLKKEQQQHLFPSIQEVKLVHQKLYQYYQIAKGECIETAFDFDFLAFCHTYGFTHAKTKITLQVLHANGIIELNDNSRQKSSIQFLTTSNKLLHFTQSNEPGIKNLVQTLLRLYGGIFEEPIAIDEFYIAKKTGTTSWNVSKQLEKLETQGILAYNKASKNSSLLFLLPREDDRTINRISKNIEAYFKQKKQKMQDVLNLVTNETECRSKLLLAYFNEYTHNNCGICDRCLLKKNETNTNATTLVLNILSKNNELSSKEICLLINLKEEDILITLRKLLANDVIGLTTYNKYFIK